MQERIFANASIKNSMFILKIALVKILAAIVLIEDALKLSHWVSNFIKGKLFNLTNQVKL